MALVIAKDYVFSVLTFRKSYLPIERTNTMIILQEKRTTFNKHKPNSVSQIDCNILKLQEIHNDQWPREVWVITSRVAILLSLSMYLCKYYAFSSGVFLKHPTSFLWQLFYRHKRKDIIETVWDFPRLPELMTFIKDREADLHLCSSLFISFSLEWYCHASNCNKKIPRTC